jgi:hypothetical protein
MRASKTCVRFLPLLSLAAVSACATPPPAGPSQTVATTANTPLGQLALAQPANPSRPRANANRVLTDKDLENIDGEALRANYGEPSFVRKEVEAELWRYDAADCAVFFFLYRDGASWRLRHAESNPRGKDTAVDPVCLGKLAQHTPPVS